MSINLQNGKTYITRGGFVVEIIDTAGSFFASKRTSPGTLGGKTVDEFSKAHYSSYSYDRSDLGWRYYNDGVLATRGLSHSLYDDLIIIGESPFYLNDIPREYTWEGEFPRIRELINNDKFFLSYDRHLRAHVGIISFKLEDIGTKRLPLVAISTSSTEPKYYKSIKENCFYVYKDNRWYLQDKYGISPSACSDDYIKGLIRDGVYVSVSKEDVDNFLSEDCQYYFRKQDYGSAYYVKKDGKWWRHKKKEGKEIYEECTKYWEDEVKDGKLIPCTKEYALSLPVVHRPDIGNNYIFALDGQGMPIYRRPKDGEYFIKYNSQTKQYGEIIKSKNYSVPLGVEDRRFILVPLSKESYSKQEQLSATVADNKLNDGPAAHNNKEKEEVVMKKETAIAIGTSVAKFVGNWGFRALNYFVLETATNIARPIVKTVRYVVFIGTIAGSIYAYRNPDVVVKTLKSCLPKVTIEAPEILS